MFKISKYLLADLMRKKIIMAYAALLLVISMCIFWLEANNDKAILSLLNIILLVTPLVSLIFTTIQYYNSYEFRELLLCQPVSRKEIFINEYLGISLALIIAFCIGIGIPIILLHPMWISFLVIASGIVLTCIFSAIAYWISVKTNDKSKGIGWSLLVWFYFAILYDGILMWLLFAFSDYPLEKFTLLFSSFNPIDLTRISLMLQMGIDALMGYSGAVFKEFMGKDIGMIIIVVLHAIWILWPLWFAKRAFLKKDF